MKKIIIKFIENGTVIPLLLFLLQYFLQIKLVRLCFIFLNNIMYAISIKSDNNIVMANV